MQWEGWELVQPVLWKCTSSTNSQLIQFMSWPAPLRFFLPAAMPPGLELFIKTSFAWEASTWPWFGWPASRGKTILSDAEPMFYLLGGEKFMTWSPFTSAFLPLSFISSWRLAFDIWLAFAMGLAIISLRGGLSFTWDRPFPYSRRRAWALASSYWSYCILVGFFSRAIMPETTHFFFIWLRSGTGILANASALYFSNLPAWGSTAASTTFFFKTGL